MTRPGTEHISGFTRFTGALTALALVVLAGSCTQMPVTEVTPIVFKPDPVTQTLESETVRTQVVERNIGADQFRLRGPFGVSVRADQTIRLSAKERIPADFHISALGKNAPLAVLLHGYGNGKADHGYQGMHLATWGINSIVLQLPNRGSWVAHGRTLARIIDHIRKRPAQFPDIDTRNILLIGHSFGASAVVYAMAQGAPVAGSVLLDPASFGSGLAAALGRVTRPVMIIGADEEVFPARGRDSFLRSLRGSAGEVSIRGAGHEDAQFSLSDDGSREEQLAFLSTLTAAAISLSSTGQLDYAWQSYEPAITAGRLFDARKK
ncbi:MAG: alpha/beta hydrolase [Burkholderiales bacterium]|nr:alpha/beta hydrolase [Burkholderiales bacterium]